MVTRRRAVDAPLVHSSRRAAWIAATPAVIAAVLALISSLISLSYSGDVETAKSQAEFLRAQRQELYVRLLRDESDYVTSLEIKIRTTYADQPPSDSALQAASKALDEDEKNLSLDTSELEIIGSDQSVEAIRQLSSAHKEYGEALAAAFISVRSPEDCGAECQDEAERTRQLKLGQVDDMRSSLRATFRHDMNADRG